MIRLALLVVLAGQSPVGNWLTRPEYQTQATRTFYVDPTGNNANACTASGTAACATLSGVFAKLPPRIVHAQTINVAAGTYTDQVLLNDIDVNAAITITGPALANVTPATGSATGTLTTVSNTNPAVMTDSGQAWTTNNLLGQWLVMTSGTQNGQLRVIATNTATTVTLASPFNSAPATSDTYAIRSPAAVFNASTGVTLAVRATGNSGGASANGVTISITGLSFRQTGSDLAACRVATSNQTVSFINSSCITTTGTAQGALVFSEGVLTLSAASIVGSGIGLITSLNRPGSLNPNNSFVHGGSSGISTFPNSSLVLNGAQTWTVQTNSASGFEGVWKLGGNVNRFTGSAAYLNLRCLQSGPSGILQAAGPTQLMYDNLYVAGCTTGINLSASGNGYPSGHVGLTGSELACLNVGTCINVTSGSRVRVPATFTTDAGIDISIDGVSYTKANLTSASPPRLPSLAPSLTGSTVWQ